MPANDELTRSSLIIDDIPEVSNLSDMADIQKAQADALIAIGLALVGIGELLNEIRQAILVS